MTDAAIHPIAPTPSLAERVAERNLAQRATWIDVPLPDLGVVVKVQPRPMVDLLGSVGFPPTMPRPTQALLLSSAQDVRSLDEAAIAEAGMSIDALTKQLGTATTIALQQLLHWLYPMGCLREPRCVATAEDITDPKTQIAFEWLSTADRHAIFQAAS